MTDLHEVREAFAAYRSGIGATLIQQMIAEIETLRVAVAAERERCASIAEQYLSPRAGIFVSRNGGEVVTKIIKGIREGDAL